MGSRLTAGLAPKLPATTVSAPTTAASTSSGSDGLGAPISIGGAGRGGDSFTSGASSLATPVGSTNTSGYQVGSGPAYNPTTTNTTPATPATIAPSTPRVTNSTTPATTGATTSTGYQPVVNGVLSAPPSAADYLAKYGPDYRQTWLNDYYSWVNANNAQQVSNGQTQGVNIAAAPAGYHWNGNITDGTAQGSFDPNSGTGASIPVSNNGVPGGALTQQPTQAPPPTSASQNNVVSAPITTDPTQLSNALRIAQLYGSPLGVLGSSLANPYSASGNQGYSQSNSSQLIALLNLLATLSGGSITSNRFGNSYSPLFSGGYGNLLGGSYYNPLSSPIY